MDKGHRDTACHDKGFEHIAPTVSPGASMMWSTISDRVAVMYLGKIVERGLTGKLFAQPRHSYTAALLSASPTTHSRRRKRIVLTGEAAIAS